MNAKQPSEILYDTEATLRLVDSAIHDMGELGEAIAANDPETAGAPSRLEMEERVAIGADPSASIGLAGLSNLVTRGYTEIIGVLGSLRQSRNLLEVSSVERLQHTHDKLREARHTTEVAATDILDGLERVASMVDELDALAEAGDLVRGAAVRAALREEVFALEGHMQFQDIASQQLNYASSVIADVEQRLSQIARVFDPTRFGLATPAVPASYDPESSANDRAERQAEADEIVASSLAASASRE